MKFFRNSIRNAPYNVLNFIEWFIVKDLDIRNVKDLYFYKIHTLHMIANYFSDNLWLISIFA